MRVPDFSISSWGLKSKNGGQADSARDGREGEGASKGQWVNGVFMVSGYVVGMFIFRIS